MLTPTKEETAARERGDWKNALETFHKHQAEFHLESNNAKNASLYVGFKDEKFAAPGERITEMMVSDIAGKNSEFLNLMYPKLIMLSRWKEGTEGLDETFAWFKTRAEELRAEMPDDPERAISTLVQEFLKRPMASPKEKGSRNDG